MNKMVFKYWDFESNELFKKLDPLVRVELALALKEGLNIPISPHVAGFDNPHISVIGDDPAQKSLAWKEGMIMRAGFITRIEVRHLTYQSEEFIKKIEAISEQVFKKFGLEE